MKKEIPILYSTAMAKAKVEMRKTQTRRIHGLEEINANPDDWQFEWADFSLKYPYRFTQKSSVNEKTLAERSFYQAEAKCPYGQPGDLLWGRESWGYTGWFYKKDLEYAKDKPLYRYRATHQENIAEIIPWKPSIHMPKEAARIWDEVISVRVERVADISVEDCIAEGIEYWNIDKDAFEGGELVADYKNYTWVDDEKHPEYWSPTFANAKYSYRSLWQLINGKPKPTKTGYIVYPFDAEAGKEFEGLTIWKGKPLTVVVNPWVWVIETKQLSVTGKPE